jgi:radical SAM protein with 4Fe4S-binding SPASM domain
MGTCPEQNAESGLFPVLSERVAVHLFPDGIHIASPKHPSVQMRPQGWEVLRLCDGQKRTEDILQVLGQCWDFEPSRVVAFLRDARERGYIEWRTVAGPTKARVFGDGKTCMAKIVSLKLTDKCNLLCTYCYGSHGPDKTTFFPSDRIDWLAARLSECGTITLELTGGEPLLHPDFPRILGAALDHRLHVSILSNGVLFTPVVFDAISAHRDSIGVQISVDGSNEETNARLRRVRGTAQRSYETIARLVEIGVDLRVSLTLTDDNLEDCTATCERLKGLGVRSIALTTANAFGRGSDLRLADGTPIYEAAGWFSARAQTVLENAWAQYAGIVEDPRVVREHLRNDVLAGQNCGAGWRKVAIDPSGDVFPCLLLESGTGKLGNVFSDDLLGMVNDTPLSRSCRRFRIRDDEEACLACRYVAHCARCMARVYTANRKRVECGEGICAVAREAGFEGAFDFAYPQPSRVTPLWGE